MNFIEELRWRGMIHNEVDLMPGTEAYLSSHKTSGYIGFDPTGESLHIGNLATIMLLVHFQRAGHKPIALVGGATGMVGDPSGKDKERQLLSLEKLRHNQECIRRQLEHFLDFEAEGNAAQVVNNYDWFSEMGFLDFLRNVGKYVTINYMTAKESVKIRLSSDSGISYTEFAYQLLQGYDFLHLYEQQGVRVQMGGADQWGNITTGSYLIHKKHGHDTEVFALTCPLITREDGSKFGKTADGESVWLSPEQTSPYQFYQYWINVSDSDAEKYIKVFTLKDKEEIDALIASHQEAPHLRSLQQALADAVTLMVHGAAALEEAQALTQFFFSRRIEADYLAGLSRSVWAGIAGNSPDTKMLSRSMLQEGINIMDLLVELGIAQSKGDARRAIEKDQAIIINAEKCLDIEKMMGEADAFHGSYLLLQRGKKNKYIVAVE